MKEQKICEYCSTINSKKNSFCMACGGPLPKAPQIKPIKPKFQNPSEVISQKPTYQATKTAKKVGSDVDKAYRGAWNAYGLFWRTLGEAIIIALISFGLGVIGGATGIPGWGVATGIVFGILVGLVVKSYLWMLIGTPVGFVLGALIGAVITVFGFSPKIILFVVFITSAASVLIGAHIRKNAHKNIYEKIRPALGGLGGLVFALLGMGIGFGLSALITNIF